MHRLALLLVAAIVGAPLRSQDDGCRACAGTGERECASHRAMLEQEKAVKFCSEAVRCKGCGGLLVRDCQSCVNAPAEADLERRRKLAADWLAARRKAVDEVTEGKDIMHLETEHVHLTFSVRPLTVGRVKLDTHALMHLYAQRIEDLRTLFMTTFEVTEKSFSGPVRVYLFKERIDHARLAPRVTGQGANSTGVKLMGVESVFCSYHNLQSMPGDEELHRNVVHNVTHLLLANTAPVAWIGNRKCGWVDEGVAHWFEDKVTGKCTNFCYEEVALTPGAGFKGGRWRVPTRRLVEAGKLGPFSRLSNLNNDELSFEDHAHAFAAIDYLLAQYGGAKVARMITSLKTKVPARDAMKAAFDIDMLAFDDALRAWIKATYPLEETGR